MEDVPEKGTNSCIFVIYIHGSNVLLLVIVFFRPVGNAPLLKQNKFKISSNQMFQSITDFLRRQLRTATTSPRSSPNPAPTTEESLIEHQALYLYVNSSFAPAADEIIGNLFACFAVDNTLIINYSMMPAWG